MYVYVYHYRAFIFLQLEIPIILESGISCATCSYDLINTLNSVNRNPSESTQKDTTYPIPIRYFLHSINSKFINRDPSNLCVCIYERRAESGDGGRVVGWTDSSIGDGRGKWKELRGKTRRVQRAGRDPGIECIVREVKGERRERRAA